MIKNGIDASMTKTNRIFIFSKNKLNLKLTIWIAGFNFFNCSFDKTLMQFKLRIFLSVI